MSEGNVAVLSTEKEKQENMWKANRQALRVRRLQRLFGRQISRGLDNVSIMTFIESPLRKPSTNPLDKEYTKKELLLVEIVSWTATDGSR